MTVDLRESDERLGYFTWAIDQSSSTQSLRLDVASSPDLSLERAVASVRQVIAEDLHGARFRSEREQSEVYSVGEQGRQRPLTMRYMDTIGQSLDSFFRDLPSQFGADAEESVTPYAEDTAYDLMLICFLGSLDGDRDAMLWLTFLMVRGGINRQLTISRFLALTTSGDIGSLGEDPPDREMVLSWAARMERIPTTSSSEGLLKRMMAQYLHTRDENSLVGVDEGLTYVEERLEGQIATFHSARSFYRRGSLVQTISAASLAATTTLLIGLNQIYHQDWLAALSLVGAGLTTVVAAWGSWFGFRKLWVDNQDTLNKLYELRSRIEYDKKVAANRLNRAKVDSYYERYQTILNEANKAWKEARSSQQ
jgi:hypothetical protein